MPRRVAHPRQPTAFKPALITYYRPSSGGINGRSGGGAWPGHPVYDSTWGAAAPAAYPFGSELTFRYNGKSVTVPVVDRGGAIQGNHFDLLPGPAAQLGMINAGKVMGEVATGGVASSGGNPTATTNAAKGALHDPFSDAINSITGGGNISIPNPLAPLEALADIFLHPQKLGALLAKAGAFFTRLILQALWDYVFAPLWHWIERAVQYYYDNIMSGELQGYYYSSAGIITMIFWGLGYGILWAKAPDDEGGFGLARTPRQTPLGKAVQGLQLGSARRNLHKPEKVEKATPNKPKTQESSAPITHTRTLSATRRRAVTVTAGGEHVGSGRSRSRGDHGQGQGQPAQVQAEEDTTITLGPRERRKTYTPA